MAKSKRSYWEYLKSDIFSMVCINTIALIIGGIALIDGLYIVTAFMALVLSVYFGAGYIDWRKRG